MGRREKVRQRRGRGGNRRRKEGKRKREEKCGGWRRERGKKASWPGARNTE